jgi:CheY-like chemotaxis protein
MPPEITCRMLIVGDEEPEHVAQLLTGCGVEARAARDPDHALSDLLHGAPFGPQAPPNAIVVNVHHDREVLVRSFKQNPATSRLPVVVLSSDTSDAHRLSMYEAGASLFLTKPAEPERLERALRRLVDFWCGFVLPPPSIVSREA